MFRSNSEIDSLIREALGEADAEAFNDLGTQSMAELLSEAFRGRHRRHAIGGAVMNLVLFSTGIVTAPPIDRRHRRPHSRARGGRAGHQ